jgi:hypothetical protein
LESGERDAPLLAIDIVMPSLAISSALASASAT